ncbi:hypothetical protein [Brevibacillus choshinensis]|nr:hypothetical protein [Brevibacillus choshinensis]
MKMRRQPDETGDRFSPEFLEWLKEKNITKKRLKKDPTALDLYHREWIKTRKKNKPRKLSIFNMIPNLNIDLGTVINNVRIASELLSTFLETKEKNPFKNNETG